MSRPPPFTRWRARAQVDCVLPHASSSRPFWPQCASRRLFKRIVVRLIWCGAEID